MATIGLRQARQVRKEDNMSPIFQSRVFKKLRRRPSLGSFGEDALAHCLRLSVVIVVTTQRRERVQLHMHDNLACVVKGLTFMIEIENRDYIEGLSFR